MSGRESDSLSDEDKDFCNSDDDHVYSESDDEELLGTDDPLPDVSDILSSERTWDMLTGHEQFNMWYNTCAANAKLDIKKQILHKYGPSMIAGEQEEGMEDSALHHADNGEIAQMIVEAAGSALQDQVVCYQDEQNLSPLHTAAWHGREDVVRFLLSLDIPEEELLFLEDGEEFELSEEDVGGSAKLNGNTALHYAANRSIAELLVNAASDDSRDNFIWSCNRADFTALHVACMKGKDDLVRYYLSLIDEPRNRLEVLCEDLVVDKVFNHTLLHLARTRQVARTIIEYVSKGTSEKEVHKLMTYSEGFEQETALHTASKRGRVGVVNYLLSFKEPLRSRLVNAKDRMHNTPLHLSRNSNITKSILRAMLGTGAELKNCIEIRNTAGESPIHSACQMGRTEVVEFWLEHYPVDVLQTDIEGNTLLQAAVDGGHSDTAAQILEFCESDEDTLISLIRHKNNNGQNVFHLAGRHCNADVDHVLKEFDGFVSMDDISLPDKHGNTPIHYLSGTQKIMAYATQLMRLPLVKRREIVTQVCNRVMLSSQQILEKASSHNDQSTLEEFFMESVVDFSGAKFWDVNSFYEFRRGNTRGHQPYYKLTIDPRMFTVNSYALNMYSLTDTASTILLSTDSSYRKESGNLWLFIDDLLIESTPDATKGVQDRILEMDTVGRHGKPKVILRRKFDRRLKLVPPGPDFIIITAKWNIGRELVKQSSWPEDSLPTNDIRVAIDNLCCRDEVKQVSVNSTLGKHLTSGAHHFLGDASKERHTITGCSRGKALIICNREGRDQWQVQFDDAKYIMESQFGLKVVECFDLMSAQIIEKIKTFVESVDQWQIAALIIQAHGDTLGNISGVDNTPTIVQDIIDAFCSGNLATIPKVVMLSFCRGGIPAKYNRVPNAFESKSLPDIIDSSTFSPARQPVPDDLKKKVHSRHKFPDVDIPVDCYVLYTTLPDSKSLRDSPVFQVMRKYLSSLHHVGTEVWTPSMTRTPSHLAAASAVREQSGDTSAALLSPLAKKLKIAADPQVDLITLFTDVAALSREISNFKVYTNYCYTIDRHSKPVFISILC